MRYPALIALAAALVALPAAAEEVFPASLVGHAVIPALMLVPPPADAPRDAWISGKFTGPARNDTPMSVMGRTSAIHGGRATGIRLPFIGQPVQGLSGFAMNRDEGGSIVATLDNGFGSKRNSGDALLSFLHLVPDFDTATVDRPRQVFLRDPDRVVPFRIAYEGTEARYLTGADFDPESIQIVGDTIWLGDEFGPFLLAATRDGIVTGVYPTDFEGTTLRSVDHPAVATQVAGRTYRVPRSGGFEGLALQPGTGLLWAVFERPILDETGTAEPGFVRALAFDPVRRRWTGEAFRVALGDGALAVGDLNFIDATRAVMIERDNGEGDPSLACPGAPEPGCFPQPARVKRLVLLDTASRDAEGFVRRIGHVDLMDIADPAGRAALPTAAARDLSGRFTMPFITIEAVMRVDDTHLLVAADNNLPFATGRQPDAAMDNEVVLLHAPAFLAAR